MLSIALCVFEGIVSSSLEFVQQGLEVKTEEIASLIELEHNRSVEGTNLECCNGFRRLV
jgi:hypothetical protein